MGEYNDLHIYTRQYCCQDRYFGVCLYADGKKVSCTPSDKSYLPDHLIAFKEFNLSDDVVRGKEFKLMWDDPDSSCAQIEELFFEYDGSPQKVYEDSFPLTFNGVVYGALRGDSR